MSRGDALAYFSLQNITIKTSKITTCNKSGYGVIQ